MKDMEKLGDEIKSDGGAEENTKYRGWKAMPYVIGNETFEKLGTMGTYANLLVYLTTVFRIKSVAAVTLLNVISGTSNLAPLLGAFISDSYIGRFWTIAMATIASLIGMLILTLTAAVPSLHPPSCISGHACTGPSIFQLTVLLSAFGFLVIGAGGIRPCNLPFGADQFDPNTESGRQGINSFFNWYYFTFTFAVMLSSTVIIYIQSSISWALGLAIPTALMFMSCLLFVAGWRIYVRVKPEGSPFTSFARVFVAAWKKRRLQVWNNADGSFFDPPHSSSLISKLPRTNQFRCLDKAAIMRETDLIREDGLAKNPWSLCSLQQVEEVKCLVRVVPILSTGIIYFLALIQQSTYVVYEAMQSDRHLGNTKFQIPAGSFTVFNMLALSIWIPIYDRLIVPWFRKMTGKVGGITLLQRMGVGMILAVLAMVVSALVEVKRRSYALHKPLAGTLPNGGGISSLSSLWLVPSLCLLGLSEAFTAIGMIEFFYKQFPENMRSVAGSLLFLCFAISNYLSSFMVMIVHRYTGGKGRRNWLAEDLNEGKLDYFYYMIAVLGTLNFLYFVVVSRWYRYKSNDGNPEIALQETRMKEPSM